MSDLNYFDKKTKDECYIIAEAGLNHNGSIKIAKDLVDLASDAGANAVKFQKRTVNQLATSDYLLQEDNRFPTFGNTYKEIREHLEFDADQYIELKKYTEEKNLDFIVTAFDIEAVDFLENLNVEIFKLASHSLTNVNLIKYLSKKQRPTILSTGMSEVSEINTAVEIFKENKCPLALMHCVSSYPTPMKDCNLALIDFLKDKYGVVTGYSGHELGYYPSVLAVAKGAKIIERHYTLDQSMEGFDHKMSLNPTELRDMIKDIRSIAKIFGNKEKNVTQTELITRKKYHVSMVSKVDIKANQILKEQMVEYKNPGTGIPYKDSTKVIGRYAKFNIPKDTLLKFEMFT